MQWTKSPEHLAELFASVVPDEPEVERRKMFGYPAAFVHGYHFAGLFQDSMVVRLPDEEYAALLALGGAPFEPMAGRTMRGYAVLPEAMLTDAPALRSWIRKAFERAALLP